MLVLKEPIPEISCTVEFAMRRILETGSGGGVDWTGLAHDRDQWWALVNEVMNLLVP
jgi:hypothetical protein